MKIPASLTRYVKDGLAQDVIAQLEQALGFELPSDFRSFLLVSDGMSIGGGTLVYGSNDLVERNETLEVGDYTPGYVAIGDSGEGSVFLMKLESTDPAVYAVDTGVMDVNFMIPVGCSIEDWMRHGCPIRQTN
ncbi:MAG: SMI1/KNR4 family protein [Pirellulaceae bacterium]|nr:SMI1/KNR4 family protein [Pirellulaceae bacterium]